VNISTFVMFRYIHGAVNTYFLICCCYPLVHVAIKIVHSFAFFSVSLTFTCVIIPNYTRLTDNDADVRFVTQQEKV
jgi:hypothetical protein